MDEIDENENNETELEFGEQLQFEGFGVGYPKRGISITR
jgi:hypothetical protein